MKLVIATGLAVLVVGCSAVPTAVPGGGQPSPATPGPGATATPGGGGLPAAGTAVVTIGDRRYEFEEVQCFVVGPLLGAGNGDVVPHVEFTLPPQDWETSSENYSAPNVKVVLERNEAGRPEIWTADGVRGDGSQVDDFTRGDSRASGNATFVETTVGVFDATPVRGTFELTCGAR